MDIKKFLEIESKYDLYHLEVDGISYWEYSRFQIWNYVFCTEKLSLQQAQRIGKESNKIGIACDILKYSFQYFISRRRPVDICFVTHERRTKEGNYYDCMYSESLIKKYPNSVVLEKPYNHSHLVPVRASNMCYTDWIIVAGNLYVKVHSGLKTAQYKKIYNQISKQLEKPVGEMQEYYQLQTSLDKVVKLCVEKYFICKKQYKMYEKLLRQLSPKVIVEVCHYSRQCMLINEIAKKMQIPTLELQHGTMHSEHAAYQYMTKEEIAQLPTGIFLFSDYWKTQINLPIDNDKLVATGFPYFESKVKEYTGKTSKGEKKTLLFVSQGTIGAQLSLLAAELSKCLDLSKYRIIYKLHPGEYADWKSRYKELAEAEIEVVAHSDKNIYYYFAESDIQIGVYSTAIYEGIGFGLDTYIYNIGHADTMRALVDGNYAKMFDTVEELLDDIRDVEQNDCRNIFWKSNALENQCKEIDKYL